MREADFMRRCMKRATDLGARLFRNNVAVAWTGKVVRNRDGSITITDPRPLHAGLAQGSADLVGWKPVVITPDMVGKTVAVFASVEVKTLRGRPTKEQVAWMKVVAGAGGFSGIARSDGDLDNILGVSVSAAQGVDKTST
jgi:hypothetical protein